MIADGQLGSALEQSNYRARETLAPYEELRRLAAA
jgi:hypothetical protein